MRKSLFVILALCLGLWAANAWAFDATFHLYVYNNDDTSYLLDVDGDEDSYSKEVTLDSGDYWEVERSDAAMFLTETDYDYWVSISYYNGSYYDTLCTTTITMGTEFDIGVDVTECSATTIDTDSCTVKTDIYGTTCQAIVTINN